MSIKLDKLGADRDRALRKRDEWDVKYKELDRLYKERENTEIHDIVHAANLTNWHSCFSPSDTACLPARFPKKSPSPQPKTQTPLLWRKSKMKRKLFSLFLTALVCMSLIAVPASAQSNENEEPLPPLTPEGNMNLVDDMP